MLKRILAVLIALLLTASCFPVAASGDYTNIVQANHYNVVLVIDGSGSLHSRTTPTDPQDYRYNAVELFLGLMTNAGNYVSAIVFDDDPNDLLLNTDLQAISGANAKKQLSAQIRAAGTGGDTDIGGALLVAAKQLVSQTKNDLPSVIVLMSDGVTDFELSSNPQEKLEASYAMREEAIRLCQDHQIPVYSVFLNKDRQLESTGELERISQKTGGAFQPVYTAEDLSEIYAEFYALIYHGGADEGKTNIVFDNEGVANIPVTVPNFGVEELNLIANSPDGVDYILITKPSGEELRDVDLHDETLKSDVYEFLKIVDPEGGAWNFEIHGKAGDAVQVNVIFNSNLGLKLTHEGAFHYESGESIAMEGFVTDETRRITDDDAYHPEFVTAELVNAIEPEERYPVEVTVEGSSFQLRVKAPEVDSSQTYKIQAVYSAAGVRADSNALVFNINPMTATEQNHPPQPVSATVNHVVEDSGDGFDYLSVEELFTDEDGDELRYDIPFSDYSGRELRVSNGRVAIDKSVLDGSFGLRASDGQAAAIVEVHLKGNAPPVPVASSVTETVTVHALFGGQKETVYDVSKWFTDADGDKLSYRIVACDFDYDKDGTVTLSQENQTLTVQTEGFRKSDLVLRAEDAKGAAAELTVHFHLFDWWLVYGVFVVLVLIVLAVLLILALVRKLTTRFKGYVLVQNIQVDGFGGGGGSYRSEYQTFRKRKVLNAMSGIDYRAAGFDGTCKIFPRSAKLIRFKSPKPFYCNGRKVKYVDISLSGSKDIFASPEAREGLRISTETPDGFGANGGFGAGAEMGGGNASTWTLGDSAYSGSIDW